MTFKHLEERPAYEDRYDRATVEECRWYEDDFLSPQIREGLPSKDAKRFPQWLMALKLLAVTSERRLHRAETIDGWVERDRRRDAMVGNARPPMLRCSACERIMECIHTGLHYGVADNEPDRVEFFLACQQCRQSKYVYEDGREVIRKPIPCTKCERAVKSERREKDGKRYYIHTCEHCGHIEEIPSVLDEEERVPTEEENRQMEHDKERFCISDEQATRYVQLKERMKQLEGKKNEHETNMDLYDKLNETKKLTIAGLEKLLTAAIKKAGYDDLHITLPPGDREIILHFSIRDTRADRAEYESKTALRKTLAHSLEDTNWALMSDGISYRLGVLAGRIRGYETEEELASLARKRMKGHKT